MTARTVRARAPTLLVVGCGDVGLRVLRLLGPHWRVLVLTSTPARCEALREAGATPLVGNLDQPASLGRLGALADRVLHLAPPPASGVNDPRTRALLRALARGGRVRHLVYGSTTGVYGDAQGARFDESRAVNPTTQRALRRVDAEAQCRAFGRRHGASVTVLRIPGIYALDRDGGDPRDRVRRGQPLLERAEDVYTNHIHADDLARACLLALFRGAAQRVIHACDDSQALMGDHYDRVADLAGWPRLPRMSRREVSALVSPMTMSFMSESRRLDNRRLKEELRLRLHYPDVAYALASAASAPSCPVGAQPPQPA